MMPYTSPLAAVAGALLGLGIFYLLEGKIWGIALLIPGLVIVGIFMYLFIKGERRNK